MLFGGGARGIMGDPVQKGMKVVAGYELWMPEPPKQLTLKSAKFTAVPRMYFAMKFYLCQMAEEYQ